MHTASTLMFRLSVFLFGSQFAFCSVDSVVLQWSRRHVTLESSVRHFAAGDLETSWLRR